MTSVVRKHTQFSYLIPAEFLPPLGTTQNAGREANHG